MEQNNKKIKSWDRITIILLVISCLVIIFSFIAPFIFTHYWINDSLDFTTKGQIGDTIGGIANPFIALAGVLLTFLAFYMQIKANQIQRELFSEQLKEDKKSLNEEMKLNTLHFQEQIRLQESQHKIQQFESQFYKMLELHKENVNELEFHDDIENRMVKGRTVFSKLISALESIYEESKTFQRVDSDAWFIGAADETSAIEIQMERFIFAYNRFFFGSLFTNKLNLKIEFFDYRPSYPISEGYGIQLAHYFRHLFLIVKFVVYPQNIELSYEQKMIYLKLLRAQLSNSEQILLFYNWIVEDFGASWENKKNNFFSNYRMIHNLRYDQLIENKYIQSKLFELKNIQPANRKGELFEMDSKQKRTGRN